MPVTTLLSLLLACAPQVDAGTALALIHVESGGNEHAIGVVGGSLDRQPRNRAEALATARSLLSANWNFSVGLAQINMRNFRRLGLTVESALDPCTNLSAMQTVLSKCYDRSALTSPQAGPGDAQHTLRRALSCYYSGNFSTGFQHGYVQRVALAARRIRSAAPSTSE
jgi:type IV secretion system protein VirB1